MGHYWHRDDGLQYWDWDDELELYAEFLDGENGPRKDAPIPQEHSMKVDTQEDAEALAEVYRTVRMARRLKSQMMEDYLGHAFVMEFVDVATKAEELTGEMIDGGA
jgi:hypothetical protein